MIIDLEQIRLEEGAGEDLPVAEMIESGGEVGFARPVEGTVHLARVGETIWVNGKVATWITLTCGRCLRPFDQRLIGTFREGFRRGLAGNEPVRGSLSEEDLVVALEGTQLDITEVARQHLLMALPMVPVCRPTCAGLCPHCGADRNERACGCATEAGDPRFEALRGFRPASG